MLRNVEAQRQELAGQVAAISQELAVGEEANCTLEVETDDLRECALRPESDVRQLCAQIEAVGDPRFDGQTETLRLQDEMARLRQEVAGLREANEYLRAENAALRVENIHATETIGRIRRSAVFQAAGVLKRGARPGRDMLLAPFRLWRVIWTWAKGRWRDSRNAKRMAINRQKSGR